MFHYHYIDSTEPENGIGFCLMGRYIFFTFCYKLQPGQGLQYYIKHAQMVAA